MTDLTVCKEGNVFVCATPDDETRMEEYTFKELCHLLRKGDVDLIHIYINDEVYSITKE